jgi:hypothetical protein
MTEQTIKVGLDGSVFFIWDDVLGADLRDLGTMTIARASHVEPTVDARWTADMGPSGGPVLGPFDRRADALAAEVVWIKQHVLGGVA